MTINSTQSDLLSIAHAHRNDRDGGYDLAAALCTYRMGMPRDRASEWDEVLLNWVQDESERPWGVALEALARAGGPAVDERLSLMLREAGRSEEWREYVANTLIRRGVRDDELKSHVEQAALRMTPMGLPNLAALLPARSELLTSAASCIVEAMSNDRHDYVEANVPPFVYSARDHNPELLVQLVRETYSRDQTAGRRLGEMVADYLEKPWAERLFPNGVAAELRERLRKDLTDVGAE